MINNYIEFSIPCTFLFDGPIELDIGSFRVILVSNAKSLVVRYECNEEVEESEFEDRVGVELARLLDRITFSYSVDFGEPIVISKSIASKVELSNRMIGSFSIVRPPLTSGQILELKQDLESGINDTTLLRMYRIALKNNNSVEKFMFLYGIIYMLYGNQEKVDDFIRTRPEHDLLEDKNSGNRYRTSKETIYTWLRNQIGHVQRRTDINEVRSKIESKLPSFQIIVKNAIIQKSQTSYS